jgi:hypothetical protein
LAVNGTAVVKQTLADNVTGFTTLENAM